MTKARFIKGLILTTVITLVFLVIINLLLGTKADWMISAYGVIAFTAISIFMFFLGNKAVSSADKYLYIRLIILNTILKIFVSFLVVGLYFYHASPTDNYFILLFLISYLSYTVFETYFMVQQSK